MGGDKKNVRVKGAQSTACAAGNRIIRDQN